MFQPENDRLANETPKFSICANIKQLKSEIRGAVPEVQNDTGGRFFSKKTSFPNNSAKKKQKRRAENNNVLGFVLLFKSCMYIQRNVARFSEISILGKTISENWGSQKNWGYHNAFSEGFLCSLWFLMGNLQEFETFLCFEDNLKLKILKGAL